MRLMQRTVSRIARSPVRHSSGFVCALHNWPVRNFPGAVRYPIGGAERRFPESADFSFMGFEKGKRKRKETTEKEKQSARA